MALTETLDLDIRAAQAQLSRLNAQLDQLSQPVNIPVNISGEQAAESLRRDFNQADNAVESLNTELAQTDRELDQIRGSARGASDAVLRVGTSGASAFSNLRGSILAVGAGLAAIQGAQILGRGIGAALEASSKLGESVNAVNVVFGEGAKAIFEYGRTSAEAAGLAAGAFNQLVVPIGSMLRNFGFDAETAAAKSVELTQRAADLASVFNVDVTEALTAIQAALRGESDPIEKFGASISAVRVEAFALATGLVASKSAITDEIKTQARLGLILADTARVAGDFANTSTESANATRILKARLEEAAATLGDALLPGLEAILTIAPGFISALENMAPSIRAVALSFAGGVGDAEGFLQNLADGLRILPTTAGGLVALGKGVTDAAQGLRDVASLDFENAAIQAEQLSQGLGGLIEKLQVSSLTGGFIEQLQGGVDPAKALANALIELNATVSNPADLQAEAEAFARISGLDASRLEDVVRLIRESQGALKLSNVEVSSLIAGLREVNLIPTGPNRPGSRGGPAEVNKQISQSALERASAETAAAREAAAAARLIEQSVGGEVDALDQLDIAARSAGVSIFDLLTDQSKLTPELQGAASILSDTSLKYLEQVDAIDTLRGSMGLLGGSMDAAAAALETTEGEIVQSFQEFFTDLQAELDAQNQLELNLGLLRIRGLDALADALESGGTAQQVQEAVENQVEAGLANARLEGTAAGIVDQLEEEILADIAGIPLTAGLIDLLIDAAAAAQTAETANAYANVAEFLQAQIDGNPLVIPLVFGPLPALFDLTGEQRQLLLGSGATAPAAPLQIVNNFFDTPQPTTDTVRVTQSLQQIRGAQ